MLRATWQLPWKLPRKLAAKLHGQPLSRGAVPAGKLLLEKVPGRGDHRQGGPGGWGLHL